MRAAEVARMRAVEAVSKRAAEAARRKRAQHGCYGVALLAFVAVVAFAAGGWYARRRWLG